MRVLFAALLAACTLAGPFTCHACTGFAVYSERTLYGMNFDYDTSVPVRLLIDESEGTRAFHVAFVMGLRSMPRTAGMNEHGLFASDQELHPMVGDASTPGPGEQCAWQLYAQALSEFATVSDINEHLKTHRMVDCPGPTLHLLFADPSGRAMIVEPGDDGNIIIPIERDYIVMTNFRNCDFSGSELADVYGVGADRYRIAHEYLEEHFEGFDVSDGLELLERSSSRWTRCSMVFDPTAGEVFVALEGDFTRTLRVSLEDATIETYSGFDEHASWRLGRLGVSTTELAGEDPGFMDRIIRFFVR
jgi:hypothetical protein